MTFSNCETLFDDLTVCTLSVDFGEPKSLQRCQQLLSELSSALLLEGFSELADDVRKTVELLAAALESNRKAARLKAAELLEIKLAQLTAAFAKAREARLLDLDPSSLANSDPMANAELLADFVVNVRSVVSDLDPLIEAMRQGDLNAEGEIKRRVHTIKGESGMLGLPILERTLHAAESYLERPASAWERCDHLLELRDWLADRVEELGSGRPFDNDGAELQEVFGGRQSAPNVAASAARTALPAKVSLPATAGLPTSLSGLTNSVVSFLGFPPPASATEPVNSTVPVPWDDTEADLVAEFLRESNENLGSVDQLLLEIEQQGADAERVNGLFRVFHTLKGVATFLHLTQITELSHTTETMLDKVRTGHLTSGPGVLDLVFDTTTTLRKLAQCVEKSLQEGCPLQLLAEVATLIERTRAVTAGVLPAVEKFEAQLGEKLGTILENSGAVAHETIEDCLASQRDSGRKLGEELMERASIAPKVIAQAIRAQNQAVVTANAGKLKEVVKVDLERVDRLVEAIGELVIVESMVSNAPEILMLPTYLRTHLGQFAKITRELQELGMCMRMVPLRAEFQKMTRMIRDLARRSGKTIRAELHGEATEMDRSMVEQLADPLVHLIRNAVDHGIETPEERLRSGKSEVATVTLAAAHEGGKIVVEISDDGRGINRDAVLRKAISRGLIAEGASLSDAEVYDLLFMPGFSTAEAVTEISGRGVGMDVVKRNIEAIRGRITTHSVPGRGTTFRLVLPLTLAIIDGMVIRCGTERFILPTLSIVESLQPTADMLFRVTGKAELVLVRGETLPLVRLDRILGVDGAEPDPTKALLVIVESVGGRAAMLVDDVVMKQQVVIKTLGSGIDETQVFYAGAAILSNGRVGLILNVEAIAGVALGGGRPALEAISTPRPVVENSVSQLN